jgi:hypothetical protein
MSPRQRDIPTYIMGSARGERKIKSKKSNPNETVSETPVTDPLDAKTKVVTKSCKALTCLR